MSESPPAPPPPTLPTTVVATCLPSVAARTGAGGAGGGGRAGADRCACHGAPLVPRECPIMVRRPPRSGMRKGKYATTRGGSMVNVEMLRLVRTSTLGSRLRRSTRTRMTGPWALGSRQYALVFGWPVGGGRGGGWQTASEHDRGGTNGVTSSTQSGGLLWPKHQEPP
jgi:hypothetical protein